MKPRNHYWRDYAKKKSCRWCFNLIRMNEMQVKCVVDGKIKWTRIVDEVFLLSKKGNSQFWKLAKDCIRFSSEEGEKFK